MTSGPIFAAVSTAVIVAAGVAGWLVDSLSGRAVRRRARRRALRRMPATAIADVKDGATVRLEGRAVASAPLLTSPLSQRPCIGYRLLVEDLVQGVDTLVDQEVFGPFLLDDGTGQAVLHPPFQIALDPYEVRVLSRDEVRSQSGPPASYELVKQSGVKLTTFGLPDQIRYTETLLEPGDEIIAFGRATIETGRATRCHLKGYQGRYGLDKPVVIGDAKEE